jgi:hypothetical protein
LVIPDLHLKPARLRRALERFWDASAETLLELRRTYDPAQGAPVFTVRGRYTSRGWTEWTQGFQYGSELLQFDATGDETFLQLGRTATVERMTPHLTHMGVHDHGFNVVSTYGALRRLMNEGRVPEDPWERRLYETALAVSGAVQARRWTAIPGGGFIYSFNGPHSLFADTMRTLRSLALAHRLGQVLLGERDARLSLLDRLVQHARTTARYAVYYGEDRDIYDVPGRVAHESVFDATDGSYRSPATQQGYSPFTTWTRGLAWVLLGFAEQLEFLETVSVKELAPHGGAAAVKAEFLRAATATADFYLANTAADGIPYWDTGAPGLARLGDWRRRPADPFNAHEPVDSSAATIAAQGLLRLGAYLGAPRSRSARARRYWQAGWTVLKTLLDEPYLSTDRKHQGLILHSVYHRPNGWDHIPRGPKVPCGESSMWGDYHAREAALYAQRVMNGDPYLTFFGPPAAKGAKR